MWEKVVGYGDSGGPLMCRDKRTQQWTVVGVTSWGERCEEQKYTPGVFAKVQHYNSYVKKVTEGGPQGWIRNCS